MSEYLPYKTVGQDDPKGHPWILCSSHPADSFTRNGKKNYMRNIRSSRSVRKKYEKIVDILKKT